jgi:hypothetical protein
MSKYERLIYESQCIVLYINEHTEYMTSICAKFSKFSILYCTYIIELIDIYYFYDINKHTEYTSSICAKFSKFSVLYCT